jgi:hypothetical protein
MPKKQGYLLKICIITLRQFAIKRLLSGLTERMSHGITRRPQKGSPLASGEPFLPI